MEDTEVETKEDNKEETKVETKEDTNEDTNEETQEDVPTVEAVEIKDEIVKEEETSNTTEEEPTAASDDTQDDCQTEKQLGGRISRRLVLVGALFAVIAAFIALSMVDLSAFARSIKFAEPEPKP